MGGWIVTEGVRFRKPFPQCYSSFLSVAFILMKKTAYVGIATLTIALNTCQVPIIWHK